MTHQDVKLWRKIILRGIGAVFSGWAVVSVFVVLLSVYGFSPDNIPLKTTAIKAVKFPENEQMLNETAARLAREGEALSKIAPAAGTAK